MQKNGRYSLYAHKMHLLCGAQTSVSFQLGSLDKGGDRSPSNAFIRWRANGTCVREGRPKVASFPGKCHMKGVEALYSGRTFFDIWLTAEGRCNGEGNWRGRSWRRPAGVYSPHPLFPAADGHKVSHQSVREGGATTGRSNASNATQLPHCCRSDRQR